MHNYLKNTEEEFAQVFGVIVVVPTYLLFVCQLMSYVVP